MANHILCSSKILDLSVNNHIVQMFQYIHCTVEQISIDYRTQLNRYNYVTPTSYLQLLAIFIKLLTKKRDEISKKMKLQNGINTLEAASKAVGELRIELEEKQPRLIKMQQEVKITMQHIDNDRKDNATMEIVEKQEKEAATKAAECQAIKDEPS